MKINEKQMENNAQVTSYLVETLNGIETVKAFHAEDKAQAKTDRLFVKLLRSVFKGGMINNAQQSLTGIVLTLCLHTSSILSRILSTYSPLCRPLS